MSFNSSDRFSGTFDRLARNLINADVDCAIEAWFLELAISKKLKCDRIEFINNIKDWRNSADVIDLTLGLYRKMVFITNEKLLLAGFSAIAEKMVLKNIDEPIFRQTVEKTLKVKIREDNMEKKLILLIAFVLTGVGVALYLLDQNKSRNTRPTGNRQPIREPEITTPPTPRINQWILVLVINAEGNEHLIQTIKPEKPVRSELGEPLYRATQGLWIGTKYDFDNSDELKRYFTEMSEVPENERSAYDVNFVEIQLNEPEPKFERGVNSMEWADAFQELPNKDHEVIRVSPRLSCRTYENDIFYR